MKTAAVRLHDGIVDYVEIFSDNENCRPSDFIREAVGRHVLSRLQDQEYLRSMQTDAWQKLAALATVRVAEFEAINGLDSTGNSEIDALRGFLHPDGDDDSSAGVREPRVPYPPNLPNACQSPE